MLNRNTAGAALISVLLASGLALPAFAADNTSSDQSGGQSGDMSQDNSMPATKAQAEQLKSVPDDASGAPTGEQGMEAGGMPATEAQKEQLKETSKMSTDKAETPGTDD